MAKRLTIKDFELVNNKLNYTCTGCAFNIKRYKYCVPESYGNAGCFADTIYKRKKK